MMDSAADDLMIASIGRSPGMTLWVGLTHPALTKLTFMDYLLSMLRSLLRRKQGHDTNTRYHDPVPYAES